MISCAGPGPGADRVPLFTLLLENPGSELASGSAVGIFTFIPGLAGMPLQECCAQAASPHIVDCYVPNQEVLPAECWYYVYRVSKSERALGAEDAPLLGHHHHGHPIVDGDTGRLMSAAHDRHCSVRHDGTLLCVDRGWVGGWVGVYLSLCIGCGAHSARPPAPKAHTHARACAHARRCRTRHPRSSRCTSASLPGRGTHSLWGSTNRH
jgi:hypothetical protein